MYVHFDRSLDVDETGRALIDLQLYSSDADVHVLFDALDTDKSGDLDWEEFKVLTKLAQTTNFVVDYIPLQEIFEVLICI